jgi:hypothetical protein
LRIPAALLAAALIALSGEAALASAFSEAAIVADAAAAAEDYFGQLRQLMDDTRSRRARLPLWEWVGGGSARR